MLHTFADHAPAMRAAGWAVLPAVGKKPIRTGFNTWKGAPSPETIDRWAERNPDADIVYVPGLCRTINGRVGILAIDPDDSEAIGQAEELFGPTPGKVRTRRGAHRLYDGFGIDLGDLTSLKKFGFNIDIKHGQKGAGIVAAPPSPFEKDRSRQYEWDGCDHTVIRHLPPPRMRALYKLIDKSPSGARETPSVKPFRAESRGLGLNDYLVSRAWAFDGIDSALSIAHAWNEGLPHRGREKLSDAEVLERTRAVLKDLQEGKIERRHGMRATCTSDADEIRTLSAMSGNGDAFTLLQLFRAEHGARCRRGETFAINADAMEAAKVLGSWSAKKYRAARDVLLRAGLIRITKEGSCGRGGRVPTQYILAPRMLTPSMAQRGQ